MCETLNLETLRHALDRVMTCLEKFEQTAQCVEESINKRYDELEAKLRQERKEQVDQFNSRRDANLLILNGQITLLKQNIHLVENCGQEPPLYSCPVEPMIHCGDIESFRYTRNLGYHSWHLEGLKYGKPYFAELDEKESFIEPQTLSGTVSFILKDMANRPCQNIKQELLSAEVVEPRNCAFDVRASQYSSESKINVSVIVTEKAELNSTVKIRVFYNGFELVQPSGQEVIPKADHTMSVTLYDGTTKSLVANSFAYGSELFVTDGFRTVQVLDLTGKFKRKWGGQNGNMPGEFSHVGGIVVLNDEVLVADHLNHRIQVFDLFGNYIREIACNYPDKLVLSNGLLWVSSKNCIRALDNNGQLVREVLCDNAISSFSIKNKSQILVKFVREGWCIIGFDGKKIPIVSQGILCRADEVEKAQMFWMSGDFGVEINDEGTLTMFNQSCFPATWGIAASSWHFKGFSYISISLLKYGKLVITGFESGRLRGSMRLVIMDSGLDFPESSSKMLFLKYLHQEETKRNISLKDIRRLAIPMFTDCN
jgi:hypothetical protein